MDQKLQGFKPENLKESKENAESQPTTTSGGGIVGLAAGEAPKPEPKQEPSQEQGGEDQE